MVVIMLVVNLIQPKAIWEHIQTHSQTLGGLRESSERQGGRSQRGQGHHKKTHKPN